MQALIDGAEGTCRRCDDDTTLRSSGRRRMRGRVVLKGSQRVEGYVACLQAAIPY